MLHDMQVINKGKKGPADPNAAKRVQFDYAAMLQLYARIAVWRYVEKSRLLRKNQIKNMGARRLAMWLYCNKMVKKTSENYTNCMNSALSRNSHRVGFEFWWLTPPSFSFNEISWIRSWFNDCPNAELYGTKSLGMQQNSAKNISMHNWIRHSKLQIELYYYNIILLP